MKLFALMSHSLSMTSSLLLISFAIFRALDIFSANSVNIMFLATAKSCMIKARADGDSCLYILLVQLCDTIVGIITVYLTVNCCRPYLQSEGLLFHYVPMYCAHTLCFTGIPWTQWRSQQLVEVLLICWCTARYNSFCLPIVFRISTCIHCKSIIFA